MTDGPSSPPIRHLELTESTNREALRWAAEGAPEGALVVADYQTAGRGRLDRSWFAPPGQCLLFSMVLRPRIDGELLGLVSLAAGVAACEACAGAGVEASIKWPNDVMVDGRKVAGILSEAADDVVVLGVGINVTVESFPGELAATATSLLIARGVQLDRFVLLDSFSSSFAELYADLPGRVPAGFRRWSSTLGTRVRVALPGGILEGTALDIDPRGALVLDTGDVVSAGDVVHLR